MRLTASLPTFTRLSASVTPAILRTEIPERGTSHEDRLFDISSHPLVTLEDLRDENSPSRSLGTSRCSILPAGVTRLRV